MNTSSEYELRNAAANGAYDTVGELLDQGINIHCTDWHEDTPLHYASRCGYYDIVQLLIERGADADKQNVFGKSPKDYANANGYHQIEQYLLKHEKMIVVPEEEVDDNDANKNGDKTGDNVTSNQPLVNKDEVGLWSKLLQMLAIEDVSNDIINEKPPNKKEIDPPMSVTMHQKEQQEMILRQKELDKIKDEFQKRIKFLMEQTQENDEDDNTMRVLQQVKEELQQAKNEIEIQLETKQRNMKIKQDLAKQQLAKQVNKRKKKEEDNSSSNIIKSLQNELDTLSGFFFLCNSDNVIENHKVVKEKALIDSKDDTHDDDDHSITQAIENHKELQKELDRVKEELFKKAYDKAQREAGTVKLLRKELESFKKEMENKALNEVTFNPNNNMDDVKEHNDNDLCLKDASNNDPSNKNHALLQSMEEELDTFTSFCSCVN